VGLADPAFRETVLNRHGACLMSKTFLSFEGLSDPRLQCRLRICDPPGSEAR